MPLITETYTQSLAYDPTLLAARQATKNAGQPPFAMAKPSLADPTPWRAKDTASALASETATTLLRETEETTTKPAPQAPVPVDDGDEETTLPIGVQHGLEDVANDPEYAEEMADLWGTQHELVLIPMEMFPKNGDPDSVWNDFGRKMDQLQNAMSAAKARREDFYEKKVAEGLPPDEIYAQLLDFIAKDDGLNSYLDKMQNNPPGTRASTFQAMHDHLRGAMAERDALAMKATAEKDEAVS